MDAPKILVVDDRPENRNLIGGILHTEGFRVISAANGPDGFAAACRESPDLILLDVLMPGESGFATCARLKSERGAADIPVIFLSALDDVQAKVSGLGAGAVDYITKPVCDEELLARVRTQLRLRESNRAAIREQTARLERLRSAQNALLVDPAALPEARFAVLYRPLEETGGDFYDVVRLDADSFAYFVADVSGHGTGAALLGSAIKVLLRERSGPLFSPEDAMHGIDEMIRSVFAGDQYLTACYARLNRRGMKLSLVSAGHPPAILVNRDGAAKPVHVEGDPLGVFSSTVLCRRDIRVAPGDRFFLYTDGLIDTSSAGQRRVGIGRLAAVCGRHREAQLGECVAAVVDELHPDRKLIDDDLLLMAVDVCAAEALPDGAAPGREREMAC